jgi:hypothetical protein
MGDLSDPESPLQFGMPSPEQFAAAMEKLGVGDDSRVVLYDTMGSSWAARVWWMLRWIGFDRAALLDGGLTAWTAAGGSLSAEPVERAHRSLTVNLRPELIAGQEEVRAAIDDDAIRLVDALPAITISLVIYRAPPMLPFHRFSMRQADFGQSMNCLYFLAKTKTGVRLLTAAVELLLLQMLSR